MTYIIASLINLVIPFRVEENAEKQGLDIAMHGEEAYTEGEGALLILERDSLAVKNLAEQNL